MSFFFLPQEGHGERVRNEGFMAVWIFIVRARLDGLIAVLYIQLKYQLRRFAGRKKENRLMFSSYHKISPTYLISLVSVCGELEKRNIRVCIYVFTYV